MREPKTTALIFKNGKMVITGAKSERDSALAAQLYTKAIKNVGNPVKFTDFKIQNMVASCSVNFKNKLEALYQSDHQKFCDFNPETFPGLIYHLQKPKVCLLIFASGKIVLTGAKTIEDINKAFKEIQPLLRQHVKKDLREESNPHGSTAASISARRGKI
jgi:transcription initiation factor TFIID TATA-box-binding protein